jgi:hypothetical protein
MHRPGGKPSSFFGKDRIGHDASPGALWQVNPVVLKINQKC